MADEKPPEVAAHQQAETHHYVMHFPAHPARENDPHYVDFNHYHRKTRGAARCWIGERIGYADCRDAQKQPCPAPADDGQQPGLELHHHVIEFSLQQGVDLAALEKDYPGVSDPLQVGAWVESATNFRWLCVTEGSPILMANGTAKPIEAVLPGDQVIGGDGRPHLVTASSRKRYRGEVVAFGAVAFTPAHRLLGHGQWLAAGDILREVGMHGPQVIALRCEQKQVGPDVVGTVSVNVVDALLGQKRSAYPLFHDQDVLHDQTSPAPDPDVALRCDLGCSVADIPFRQRVQASNPGAIGAVKVLTAAPVRRAAERPAAGYAVAQMGWIAAMPRRASFTGWVHDLSVAHSHSFVAGGIVAHNCAFHHRGPAGAHTASHSDWSASAYVHGLIT